MSVDVVLERISIAYLQRDLRYLRESIALSGGSIARLLNFHDENQSSRSCLPLIAIARGAERLSAGERSALSVLLFGAGVPQERPAWVDELASIQCRYPDAWEVSLYLGYLYSQAGLTYEALTCWTLSISSAQGRGECIDEATTPVAFLRLVSDVVPYLRANRDTVLFGLIDRLEGGAESPGGHLDRVREAVAYYLKQKSPVYPHPHQRPRFLFIPGLPCEPWLPRESFPQFKALENEYERIKADALEVVRDSSGLEDFVPSRPGIKNHLGGASPNPRWEAFFFYRHGRRIADSHERCPFTSGVLDALDLCRIDRHAPEVCFSVLRAGTRILPHYGVTNARSVLHLPLVVPQNCAMSVIGAGTRAWNEGCLLAFDDTFEHEAWNDSDSDRIILLLDCWNPHLTIIERTAITQVIKTISRWHGAAATP